jgi:hypothetical protein
LRARRERPNSFNPRNDLGRTSVATSTHPQLPSIVGPPATHASVGVQRACVVASGGHSLDRLQRYRNGRAPIRETRVPHLAEDVAPPADHAARLAKRTTVFAARGDGLGVVAATLLATPAADVSAHRASRFGTEPRLTTVREIRITIEGPRCAFRDYAGSRRTRGRTRLRSKTTGRRGRRTVDDTVTVVVPSVADLRCRFDGSDAWSPDTFRTDFDPASALSFVAPNRTLTLGVVRTPRVGSHRCIDPASSRAPASGNGRKPPSARTHPDSSSLSTVPSGQRHESVVKSGTKPNLPHSSSAEDDVHATRAIHVADASQRIVRVYRMNIRPPTREHWP